MLNSRSESRSGQDIDEPDFTSPQQVVESFTNASLRFRQADEGTAIIEKFLDLPRILSAGFYEYWRVLEKTSAIKEWQGTEGGREILNQEQLNNMEKSIYGLFIAQLQREGMIFTQEEIESGYEHYSNH